MKRRSFLIAISSAVVAASSLFPTMTVAQEGGASARLAAPGEEIKRLQPLIGEWTVKMTVTPAPGAQSFPINGLTATRTWILDGRYLRETLKAGTTPMRDATFGYNRLDGRYELVTVDAFEPGQMVYRGRSDQGPGPISMFGESTEAGMAPEPTGRKRDLRFQVEIVDANTNVQRIFATYPGGKEFLFVEQVFSKAK